MQRRQRKEGRVRSLNEVATLMGMPQTTIQSIEKRAILKCRAYMAQHRITIGDLIDDTTIPIGIDTTHAEARFDADSEVIQ